MSNQPAEAYHCRNFLIKHLIHPKIASKYTTWEAAKVFLNFALSNENYDPDKYLHPFDPRDLPKVKIEYDDYDF